MEKITVNRDDLLKTLMLVIENDSTSASGPGLKLRAKNRKVIIDNLLSMLDMTKEEADELFWKRDDL